MASRFQAVPLVASPTHPDAVAWSNENMVAIASGHLVTILNPAMPCGPKGLIIISTSKPFSIGVIKRKDLLAGCMLPTCLSRVRPCVRSISWSPHGLAPNAGCLLAVCTTDGVVKVYRSPFCEFSAEWVEVMDVSEMLHGYFDKMGYGDGNSSSSKDCEKSQLVIEEEQNDDRQTAKSGMRSKRSRQDDQDGCSISAEEYACRNAMVSSVVVAWSPMVDCKSSRRRCSILAIGAKSGRISFWRVHEPQFYSISKQSKPPVASLIGLIQAHNSWVTAISWSKFVSDGSPQLLLSTGSSDGSVKVWRGYTDDILKFTSDGHASFSLLEEAINVGSSPASVLALTVQNTFPHKIILAVGKGSGSIQVWTYNASIDKFDVIGSHSAHDQIVTGLAWAYDGRCLYSCSQDNTLRSWIIKGDSLDEVPLPSNILGVKISNDVPNASDACFGIAVSPANLVIAVVRSFDGNLLNPMYQARSQKAVVEFFWIGGQKLQEDEESDDENFPGFPNIDLVSWEYNILWSLNQYEDLNKPMVLWDIIAALSAFKKYEVHFVEQTLVKWLVLSMGFEWGGPSLGIVPPHVYTHLPNLTSRQLHLINVINRHVILTEPKLDNLDDGEQREGPNPWIMLLEMCEKEVRERIIGCSFSATLNNNNNSNWQPVGLAQMRQWVANDNNMVKEYVKLLASKVEEKIEKKYLAEEECSYCSTGVPFKDTEVAFCSAEDYQEKHKLLRCAVSMTVCPLSPLWFCVSCKRWVSNLAPETFFSLPSYSPANDHSETLVHNGSSSLQNAEILSKTLCPFCGILLQRLQPQFLLSTSPV